MPPKQKATFSGHGKSSKSAGTLKKRSAATSSHGEKPKTAAKRRRTGLPNPSMDEDLEEQTVVIGESSSKPIELKNPTSFAERKRRRATLSMKEIFAESSKKEEVIEDFAAEFGSGSMALYTWGPPINQPVPAVRNMRRHGGFRALGFCRGKQTAFERFMFGTKPDAINEDDTSTPFRFMDLPLEIRWRIYGYVLIHPKPILVYSDWQTVHYDNRQDHTLLRASKQILLETTQFLYEKNVFHAVIQSVPPPKRGGKFIKKEFLPYLRNVIVECEPETRYVPWGEYDMVNAVTKCFQILVRSECFLDSLTLLMSPTKGKATASLSNVTQPNAFFLIRPVPATSFAKYFEVPASKIMRVIPKLRCKVFNIILRLPEKKRVLVSIDLRGLPVNQDKSGWFAEDKIAKHSWRKRAEQVKSDLMGLGKRCQEIFEDHEKAIMEGKARLLEDFEQFGDGMMLASRGQDGA